MKSKLKIAIALLLVVITLASCAPTTVVTPGDTNTSAEEPPASEQPVDLVLFDESTSYVITYAVKAPRAVIDIVSDFQKAIDEMTDINKVNTKTDFLKAGMEPDPNALEILIANTNRPESAEAVKDVAYSDFAIKKIGNKVVIAAHSEKTLKEAVDYLINNLITAEGEGTNKVIKLKSESVSNSGIRDLISSPEQLSEYRIVYAKGDSYMMNCAKEFAADIESYCGVKLNCVDDSTAVSPKEIIIGFTSREESALVKDMSGLEYAIKVVGQKIIIGSCAETATSLAVDKFESTFMSGVYSNTVRIPEAYDNVVSGNVALKGSYDPTLAEGADLRIMSFNLLAELWDDRAAATLPGRDKNTSEIILSYLPDVIGLQETTQLWYSLLESRLDGVYKFASYKVPGGKVNYSTLMYNIHTTELIECKTTLYSVRNSDSMRNLTWARFRRKSDGAEYIVTCTHWDITDDKRQVQCGENAKLINDLYEKYKLPIFATGDYNSNEEDLFDDFLKATKMTDPKYKAKKIVNAGRTTHTLGSSVTGDKLCIDHIAVSPGQEVLFYNRLTCNTALNASDHCPIYIDVKLNK